MRYTVLGPSGLRISRLVLGTSLFGVAPLADGADRLIGAAMEAGINVIDTANSYGNQQHFDRIGVPPAADRDSAEEIIGRALDGRRDRVVLCTKAGEPVGDDVNDRGLSRRHLFSQIDRSLQRLRTDHVDVLYAHLPDPLTPLETTLEALSDIVAAGKARHCALSNFSGWQTVHALWTCADRRLASPVALQVRYHLLARSAEAEVVPAARRFGLSVLAFSPLAGGLLAGPAARARPEAGEARWGGGRFTSSQLAAGERAEALAAEAGLGPGQAALAWVLSRPAVAAAVIGPENPAELTAAAVTADTELDEGLRARLDSLRAAQVEEPASRPGRPAPPGLEPPPPG